MLIAGGWKFEEQVDLVDLETGEICSFTSFDWPHYSKTVTYPKGVYIDGKVWHCGSPTCFYWNGAQWVEDTQLEDDCDITLPEAVGVFTPDG